MGFAAKVVKDRVWIELDDLVVIADRLVILAIVKICEAQAEGIVRPIQRVAAWDGRRGGRPKRAIAAARGIKEGITITNAVPLLGNA